MRDDHQWGGGVSSLLLGCRFILVCMLEREDGKPMQGQTANELSHDSAEGKSRDTSGLVSRGAEAVVEK